MGDEARDSLLEPGRGALPADHLRRHLLQAVSQLHRQQAHHARRRRVPPDVSDGVAVGAESAVLVEVPRVPEKRAQNGVAHGAQALEEANSEA